MRCSRRRILISRSQRPNAGAEAVDMDDEAGPARDGALTVQWPAARVGGDRPPRGARLCHPQTLDRRSAPPGAASDARGSERAQEGQGPHRRPRAPVRWPSRSGRAGHANGPAEKTRGDTDRRACRSWRACARAFVRTVSTSAPTASPMPRGKPSPGFARKQSAARHRKFAETRDGAKRHTLRSKV